MPCCSLFTSSGSGSCRRAIDTAPRTPEFAPFAPLEVPKTPMKPPSERLANASFSGRQGKTPQRQGSSPAGSSPVHPHFNLGGSRGPSKRERPEVKRRYADRIEQANVSQLAARAELVHGGRRDPQQSRDLADREERPQSVRIYEAAGPVKLQSICLRHLSALSKGPSLGPGARLGLRRRRPHQNRGVTAQRGASAIADNGLSPLGKLCKLRGLVTSMRSGGAFEIRLPLPHRPHHGAELSGDRDGGLSLTDARSQLSTPLLQSRAFPSPIKDDQRGLDQQCP
jgi:hypothetical protein